MAEFLKDISQHPGEMKGPFLAKVVEVTIEWLCSVFLSKDRSGNGSCWTWQEQLAPMAPLRHRMEGWYLST